MVACRVRLTASGYCRKDAYESLSLSFAAGDVERCCCLAAELACTPGEPGALVGMLIDTYAQWYVCGSLAVVVRLARAFSDMDGQPSVMRSFATTPQLRRSLCEAVILTATLPRRSSNELWRTKPLSTLPAAYEDDPVSGGVEAVRRMVGEGDGRGALSLAAALLSNPAARGKDVPPPPHDDCPVRRPHDRDVAWHLWRVASDASSNAPEPVQQFVRASLRLYAQRFTLQRRNARANLLCYALLTCARGRVGSASPIDGRVDALVVAAEGQIDGVFDDILSAASASEEEEDVDRVEAACSGGGGLDAVSGSGESEGDATDPVDYLMCYTRFDDALRCRLADERRDASSPLATIKRVIVVTKQHPHKETPPSGELRRAR
jgi:hypothetical protein